MNSEKIKKAIDYINSDGYKLSFSQWSQFVESPRHLLRYLSGRDVVGSAAHFSKKFHCLILEGKRKFDNQYLVNESGVVTNSYQERMFINTLVEMGLGEYENGEYQGGEYKYEDAYKMWYSTKNKGEKRISGDAKDKWEKFRKWIYLKVKAKREGKGIVGKSDYELMLDMRKVFRDDIDMMRIFKSVKEFEKKGAYEWVVKDAMGDSSRDFKINVSGRLDMVGRTRKGKFVADLKVLASAKTRNVLRKIVDDWLYVQGGVYCKMEGLEEIGEMSDDSYYLLVLDRMGNSNIFELSNELKDRGIEKFEEYLLWFRYCKNVNGWRRSYNFYSERGDGTFIVNPPWWMDQG